MNIFKQIKNSIYNPEYYKSVVLNESFGPSVKYLAKLAMLASLLAVIIFAVTIPMFFGELKVLVSREFAKYPDELVVNIKDGVASINKPEPYVIKMTELSNQEKNYQEENLVVIDTTKPFVTDNFKKYSTMFLLSKNEIIFKKDDKGTLQVIPLSNFSNTQITKTYLQEIESKLIKILPAIMIFVLVLMYIILFVGYFIGTLIMLLIYALLIWVLCKIKDINMTYKKAYQVGIHTSTILVILSILGIFVPVFGKFFIKAIAVLLVTYINLFPDTPQEVSTIQVV
jgi:hypothetical protein